MTSPHGRERPSYAAHAAVWATDNSASAVQTPINSAATLGIEFNGSPVQRSGKKYRPHWGESIYSCDAVAVTRSLFRRALGGIVLPQHVDDPPLAVELGEVHVVDPRRRADARAGGAAVDVEYPHRVAALRRRYRRSAAVPGAHHQGHRAHL